MSTIAEKVAKLLELAKSDNPNEAAAAVARAQELMLKYSLDEEQVRGAGATAKDEPVEVEVLHEYGGNIPAWEHCLAGVMMKEFLVRTYARSGDSIFVVGRKSARDIFRATWSYIRGDVKRLGEIAYVSSCPVPGGFRIPGHARTWKNSFYYGAIHTISERLQENTKRLVEGSPAAPSAVSSTGIQLAPAMDALATPPCVALALMVTERNTEVAVFMKKNLRLKSAGRSSRAHSSSGYSEGQTAGRTVSCLLVRRSL